MEKMVAIGGDIFDSFINDDGYYVDKSEFIYELAVNSRTRVALFTRPRPFIQIMYWIILQKLKQLKSE